MPKTLVTVHKIKCHKPQERGFFSDGDEMWARLEGDSQVKYYPSGGKRTKRMVAGTSPNVRMSVSFTQNAALEVWDCDSAFRLEDTPVEDADNELLATYTFLVNEREAQRKWITLTEGPDADEAVYKAQISIKQQ